MDSRIEILKGIHPGKLMERDLKKKGVSQRTLAKEIAMPYQTINAIIAGRRNLTPSQALKVERSLGYDEGFLFVLQAYYEIRKVKEKEFACQFSTKPNIRRILFWDVDFEQINWGLNKNAVIQRVLERGNTQEMEEIKRYYSLSDSEMNEYLEKYHRSI